MFARVEHFLFEGIGSEMSTRRCPRTTQRTIVSRSEGRSGNETKQTRGARLEGGLAVRTYGVELSRKFLSGEKIGPGDQNFRNNGSGRTIFS